MAKYKRCNLSIEEIKQKRLLGLRKHYIPEDGDSVAETHSYLIEWYDCHKNNGRTLKEFSFGSGQKVTFTCPNFKHDYSRAINKQVSSGTCPKCMLALEKSENELRILFELKHFFHNIDPALPPITIHNKQYKFDIFIPEKNIIIEYDGWFWHKKRSDEDNKRINTFIEVGYKIIRVRENGLHKVFNNDIILEPLKETTKKNILKKTVIKILQILKYDKLEIQKYKTDNVYVGEKNFIEFISSLRAHNILDSRQIEILKYLYIENTFPQTYVCKELNISKSIFCKNLIFYNLKRDKSKGVKNIDINKLILLYKQGMPIKRIASHFKFSVKLIEHRLKKLGIYENTFVKNNKKLAQSKRQEKPIIQKTICGTFIHKFDSIKKASEETGIGNCNISHVVNKRDKYKTAGGYIWEFA